MITINSDRPYLGIAFAGLLNFDIIQKLKEGFGMMNDIQRSDAKQPKSLTNELFGL